MKLLSTPGTRLMVQAGPTGAVASIAGLTRSAPCVATLAGAPTFAAGDIVEVDGTGWRALDGLTFRADAIDGPLVTLGDSDTTGETAAFAAGSLAAVAFIDFCTSTLDINAPAAADFDTTTIYDDARTLRTGMPAIRTWSAEGFWDADEQAQLRVHELLRGRAIVTFAARFPDDSGLLFRANVNSFDTRTATDQAVTISTGGSISGNATLLSMAPDSNWVIAGAPASPSAPDWIIAGAPATPSAPAIIAGRVAITA
jgi:hypothetical protein